MDDQYSEVVPESTPFNLNITTDKPPVVELDTILNELSIDDYKSIFFLLSDQIKSEDYLYYIKQNKEFLKERFRDLYYEFQHKDHLLVEILGTMQKFKLLLLLKMCRHIFNSIKESTFSEISSWWKCLYALCEQLSDAQVSDLKIKLLSDPSITITCAEELFCVAIQKNVFKSNDFEKLAEVFKNFHPGCYNLIMHYKALPQLKFYPIRVPTKESRCGLAVIISQEKFIPADEFSVRLAERSESHLDACALKDLWENYGLKTRIYKNLTDKEIMERFELLSAEDHSSIDVFVVCLMSHGNKGIVYGSNCRPVVITNLSNVMANNCPTLVGKPKLFFVQACQGLKVQEGVLNHTIEKEELPKNSPDISCIKLCINTPIYIDVLLVVSSIENYVSYSSPGKNSWFIGTLVKLMKEYGENYTIINIIHKLQECVAQKSGVTEDKQHKNCKQTIDQRSTLRKELKFKKLKHN